MSDNDRMNHERHLPGMTVPRKAKPLKGITGGIGLIAPLLKRDHSVYKTMRRSSR